MKLLLTVLALLGLSVGAALADTIAPSAITDLTVVRVGKTTVVLSFTAPGDDTTSGTATQYDLRIANFAITAANFNSATPVSTASPNPAGTVECADKFGLTKNTTYWMAIKTADEVPNWSGISNVVSFTTHNSGNDFLCP